MGITIAVMQLGFPLYKQMPDSSLKAADIVVNLTMLQGLLLRPSVDGAYWTLGLELRFYGFIWLVLLLRQRKNLIKWTLCWVLLSLEIEMMQRCGISGKWLVLMRHLFVPQWCPIFAAGVVLALWYSGGGKEPCIVGIITVLTALLTVKETYLAAYFVSLFLLGGIVVIRRSRAANDYERMINKVKGADILGFIAGISYPLYLLHQHVGFAIIWNCEERGMSNAFSIAVAFLSCLLLAWGVQQFANRVSKMVQMHR